MMVEPHFLARDVVDRIRMVLRFKRRFSSDQLIQRYADSPTVYLLSVTPTQKHLRSFVVASSSVGEHLLISSSQLHIFALPEVYQLDNPSLTIIQYVLGLDVPVANALLMDVCQRIEYPIEDEPQTILIQPCLQ